MAPLKDITRFVNEAGEDLKSPTTSDFMDLVEPIKLLVSSYDQVFEMDKSGITKLRKSIKAMLNSGNEHLNNIRTFEESVRNMADCAERLDHTSTDVAGIFKQFADIAKDVVSITSDMISALRSTAFPLDKYVSNKEVQSDSKKSFEKSYKDLENKFTKEKKERQRAAELNGLRRKVHGSEVAEELDKERKQFQLATCEHLIRVNEVQCKRGADLINYLIKYYQSQSRFYEKGMERMSNFSNYISELNPKLTQLRTQQDTEKRQLLTLKEQLTSSLQEYKEDTSQSKQSRSSVPLVLSKDCGTERDGYLLKKSEGKIKKWQKRRLTIKDGFMSISHSDENKDPVKLNLLTCQAKLVVEDPVRRCFDLLSSTKCRTYHFQAEDEQDLTNWISVLNNAREEQLMNAFSENSTGGGNEKLQELRKQIIARIRQLPGNAFCCDCNASDPEWLSVNFGVLICLECCGVHREMSVDISRTQSLVIDEIGTAQLLIASMMSNEEFNSIMEVKLTRETKKNLITPESPRDERNTFIRLKYESRRYIIKECADETELKLELLQAVRERDLTKLLQAFAEGADLMAPLPAEHLFTGKARTHRTAIYDTGETALHKSVKQENGTSLHIINFLVQNCRGSDLMIKDLAGNTALHVAADYNQSEAMKLILRANCSHAQVRNLAGKLPIDIAKENKFHRCIDLLQYAAENKSSQFENINVDWISNDDYTDCSDDELESVSPEKQTSRPGSYAYDQTHQRGSSVIDSADLLFSRLNGSEQPKKEQKKSTLDRVRRKTTDIVMSPFNNLAGSPNKSSLKEKLTARFGHSRTVSDTAGIDTGSKSKDFNKLSIMAPLTSEPVTSSNDKFNQSPFSTFKPGQAESGSQPKLNLTGSKSKPDSGSQSNLTFTESPRMRPKPKTGDLVIGNTRNSVASMVSQANQSSVSLGKGINQSTPSLAMGSQSDVSLHSDSKSMEMPPPPLPDKRNKPSITASSSFKHSGSVKVMGPSLPLPPADSSSEPLTNISTNIITSTHKPQSPKPEVAPRRTGPPTRPQPKPKPKLARMISSGSGGLATRQRCRALYDCNADNVDELTFYKNEVIVITKSAPGSNWWEGEIDGDPKRRGLFPTTHITMISDT